MPWGFPVSDADWSRAEVEAAVSSYLAMWAEELAGRRYSKTEFRRALLPRLAGRSKGSVEFKHQNISAAMVQLGLPFIPGYKPRSNFQDLVLEVLAERVATDPAIERLAAEDADRAPAPVPTIDDILALLDDPPPSSPEPVRLIREPRLRIGTNYLEREARNQELGAAGEEFVLRYEQARLVRAGHERLAARIEHVSRSRGDGAGFDILSFDDSGRERFIEVKTTKYAKETPFFVSRTEVAVSAERSDGYHLYRVFNYRRAPRLFTLPGSLRDTCDLDPTVYVARVA